MPNTSKLAAVVARSAASVSTKLSIAAVLGIAIMPLLPEVAASKIGASEPKQNHVLAADIRTAPAPPIEVVRSKAVPLGKGASLEEPGEDPTYATSPFHVAARRSRSRSRQERAEDRRKPDRTASAIAMAAPPDAKPPDLKDDSPQGEPPRADRRRHNGRERLLGRRRPMREPSAIAAIQPPVPAPPVESKPETAQAEPPKPDVWSEAEIIAALRDCIRLLGPIAADVEVAAPVKQEQCGAPAPIMLKRVGSGANRVEINPPAMVNCAMVVGLHNWVEKTLQPAAQDALGSHIVRLRSASGYMCRNRNGSLKYADRLSEHALANAIDIAGFITADGRTIDVARYWGPTERDRREAQRIAAAQARDARLATPKIEPPRRRSTIAEKASDRRRGRDSEKGTIKTSELQRLGRGVSDRAIPIPPSAPSAEVEKSAEAAFLRRLHKGACGVFGTVLGPEANEAHRDHFHFDMAARKRSAFCE